MAENNKPKAYQGPNKYIFVSYSHKDNARVWPFIVKLQEKYNVWFDEGIQAGSEWDKKIVSKLEKCSVFLFIVSQNSLNSKYCQNEIAFADDANIPFVNIFIDKAIKKPNWFKFRYGRFQDLSLFEYKDLVAAVNDLDKKTEFNFKTVLKTNNETPSGPQNNKPTSKLSYLCPHCTQKFDSIEALASHVRDKHPNAKKKFYCLVCGKPFSTELGLQSHMVDSHSIGAKPQPQQKPQNKQTFKCPVCGKKCPDKVSLDNHMKQSHPKHDPEGKITGNIDYSTKPNYGFSVVPELMPHLGRVKKLGMTFLKFKVRINVKNPGQFPIKKCTVVIKTGDFEKTYNIVPNVVKELSIHTKSLTVKATATCIFTISRGIFSSEKKLVTGSATRTFNP